MSTNTKTTSEHSCPSPSTSAPQETSLLSLSSDWETVTKPSKIYTSLFSSNPSQSRSTLDGDTIKCLNSAKKKFSIGLKPGLKNNSIKTKLQLLQQSQNALPSIHLLGTATITTWKELPFWVQPTLISTAKDAIARIPTSTYRELGLWLEITLQER